MHDHLFWTYYCEEQVRLMLLWLEHEEQANELIQSLFSFFIAIVATT
jgi:hypothetical protein